MIIYNGISVYKVTNSYLMNFFLKQSELNYDFPNSVTDTSSATSGHLEILWLENFSVGFNAEK